MLRAFDSEGNVIYEQPRPIDYQQNNQTSNRVMTPEEQFAINLRIYRERMASGTSVPQPSQSYNNTPPPIIQGSYQQSQPMNGQYYSHPAQQQAQAFLRQEYNNRIGGMNVPYPFMNQPTQPIATPQPAPVAMSGIQAGLLGFGYTDNTDYYLRNNNYYGYQNALQQQQVALNEYRERMRVQIEIQKKISRAAHTYLGHEVTDEQLSEVYDPKPQRTISFEEQLEIEHDAKLANLTTKMEYMEQNHMTEYEYQYMVATPLMKQRMDSLIKKQYLIHDGYKSIASDDMSLVDFLNGPANDLYYDSMIIEMRNQRKARRLEYDKKMFNKSLPGYVEPTNMTTYVNLPEHLKKPSVFDTLKVDESWFSPEADKFREDVKNALNKSGFNDPENYEYRKQIFFNAVKNGG